MQNTATYLQINIIDIQVLTKVFKINLLSRQLNIFIILSVWKSVNYKNNVNILRPFLKDEILRWYFLKQTKLIYKQVSEKCLALSITY